jgi:hypothetical protein
MKTSPEVKKKARLVVRGFTQRHGLHYFQTFAPTVRPESIRAICSTAALLDLKLFQTDIKTAFLNGKMDADIYMRPAEGMQHHPVFREMLRNAGPRTVLKVVGSVYGTKQAQRIWFKLLRKTLLEMGFTPTHADACVYVRKHGTDLIYLGVYVDDILSAVTSDAAQEWFLNELKKRFKISHSIPAKKFVGVDIKQDLQQGTVSLSMGSYLEELFEEAGLSNCNTATTPAKPGTQLWDDPDSPLTEATPYRSRVGALLFVARHRPDIAFSVNACARFMQRPRQCHFQASTRIMRYLRGTMHTPVVFCHRLTRSGLTAYADSDWGGDRDSGRSTSACVVYFGGPIYWFSRLQRTPALSSAEAEYMSASDACATVLFCRQLLSEMLLSASGPTSIFTDSKSAIAIAADPIAHKRTKHINIRYHFIRSHSIRQHIDLRWTPGQGNIADLLTKPVSVKVFDDLLPGLLGLLTF